MLGRGPLLKSDLSDYVSQAHVTTDITATDAARHFRDVLNQIEGTGEIFRIQRHGRSVAEMRPISGQRRFTGQDLVDLLRRLPQVDPEFESDLAEIRSEWQAAPLRDPWQP
jgi:antitoxin (DNA-binding transcriptional repressor) of toxin-antitoxin stability system